MRSYRAVTEDWSICFYCKCEKKMLLFSVRLLLAFTRVGSRTLPMCACECFVCTAKLTARSHTHTHTHVALRMWLLPYIAAYMCFAAQQTWHMHEKCELVCLQLTHHHDSVGRESLCVCVCLRDSSHECACAYFFHSCRFSFAYNYCSCVLSLSVYFVLFGEHERFTHNWVGIWVHARLDINDDDDDDDHACYLCARNIFDCERSHGMCEYVI